jgi:hypothetical protein
MALPNIGNSLAALRKSSETSPLVKKPVYRLNDKRWQLKGLAGSADGLNASGPEERHVLGAKCLRALLLLHMNVCGNRMHSHSDE